jgi:hypothetical protein
MVVAMVEVLCSFIPAQIRVQYIYLELGIANSIDDSIDRGKYVF